MSMPWDQNTLNMLRDKKLIDEDQYAKIQSKLAPTPIPAPTPAPSPPTQSSDGAFSDANLGTLDTAAIPKPETIKTSYAPPQQPPVQLASDFQPQTMQDGMQGQAQGQNQFTAYQQAMAAPFALQQVAIGEGLLAGEAKGAETAAYLKRVKDDDIKMQEANSRNEIERQAKLDEQMRLLDTRAADVLNTKIDGGRLWANMSTGDKILAGIGIFLGSFGSGDRNTGADAINRAIDRDIDLQKAALENKRAGYTAQRGILTDMMDQFKDKRLAEEAARVAYLNNAQIEINRIASKYQGQEQKAKAMELYAQVENQKQNAMMQFAAQWQKMNPTKVSGAVDPELLDEKQRERYVPGFGLALTKDDAKDFKAYVSEFENAKGQIGQLVNLASKAGKTVSIEDRSQAELVASMLKGSLRTQILGPGAVSDREREILDAIVANPTLIFSLDKANKTRLDTLLSTITTNRDNKAKFFGLTSPEVKLKQDVGFTTASK